MTKAKLVLKILSWIVLLTTVLMTLILSVFIISRLVNKNNYSKVFGYSLFEVTSNSMYPYLEQGDLILVKERNKEESNELNILSHHNMNSKEWNIFILQHFYHILNQVIFYL